MNKIAYQHSESKPFPVWNVRTKDGLVSYLKPLREAMNTKIGGKRYLIKDFKRNKHILIKYQGAVNTIISTNNGSSFLYRFNILEFQRLLWMTNRHWVQQKENIKWLVLALFAALGAFIAFAEFILECNC